MVVAIGHTGKYYTILELLFTYCGIVENKCLVLRGQFRLATSHASQGETEVANDVALWVDSGGIRAEVVHFVVTDASRGPPAAVATLTAQRAIVEVA